MKKNKIFLIAILLKVKLLIITIVMMFGFSSSNLLSLSNTNNFSANTQKNTFNPPRINSVNFTVVKKGNQAHINGTTFLDNFPDRNTDPHNLTKIVFAQVHKVVSESPTKTLRHIYSSQALPAPLSSGQDGKNAREAFITSTDIDAAIRGQIINRSTIRNETLKFGDKIEVRVFAGYAPTTTTWDEIDTGAKTFTSAIEKNPTTFTTTLRENLIFGTSGEHIINKHPWRTFVIVAGTIGGALVVSGVGYLIYRAVKTKKELGSL